MYKKLSYLRETARYIVSLNIALLLGAVCGCQSRTEYTVVLQQKCDNATLIIFISTTTTTTTKPSKVTKVSRSLKLTRNESFAYRACVSAYQCSIATVYLYLHTTVIAFTVLGTISDYALRYFFYVILHLSPKCNYFFVCCRCVHVFSEG